MIYSMKHKIIPLLIVCLLLTNCLFGQATDSLVNHGLKLEKAMQEAAALQQYLTVLKTDSFNLTALNRSAILTIREGKRQKTAKAAIPYYRTAKDLASTALRTDPDNKESLVAMATALRQLSLHAGAKEKAAYLKEIKADLDKALQIDAAYAPAWHALGNWNYDISKMNFAERAATKLLFGGLPDASFAAAIKDYLKCQRLDPAFILNISDLAKAYHANEEDLKAITALKQAIRLRPILQDDRMIQQECKKMLESLQ